MLQRHRAGAKQPLFRCLLRQSSLIVAYSPRKFTTKYFFRSQHGIYILLCYLTLAPPPIERPVPQSVARRVYPVEQAKQNESRKLFREPWQGKNRGAGRGTTSASAKGPSSARFFSRSTTAYPNQILYRRIEPSCPFDKNTTVPRLGPNVLRRNNVRSYYGKQALGRSVLAPRNSCLVDRFRRLEAQMNKIRDHENLNMAFECFEVLEKAIGDIVKSESGAAPASLSDRESAFEQSEEEIEEDTANTTDAESQPVMGFFPQTRLVNFEDLKFTSEPNLPYIPLTAYQIPEGLLQKRQLLQDGAINKVWSHSLYLNRSKQPPRVHYCKSPEQAEEIAALFLKDKVIGFDIEWDPWVKSVNTSPRSQVSLVQIANQSHIALFHLAVFGCDDKELLPPALQKVLVSENILKVGVSISGDSLRIYKYLKIIPQGVFELSDLQNLLDTARQGGGLIPRRLVSLSDMTKRNLLLPLRKGNVRLSNWKKPLTERQIEYAASDAYAGLRIFDALEGERHELRPFPPLPPCRKMEQIVRTVKTTREAAKTRPNTIESKSDEANVKTPFGEKRFKRLFRNPETEQADNWAYEYISKKGSPLEATLPQLRAYAMWHERGYDLEKISTLWRDPPLKLQTLATYILDAIRLENLPYAREKVKDLIGQAGPEVWHKKYPRRWM